MIVNDYCIRPIHPFPARMAPAIALESLKVNNRKSLRVLDPMSGSGTSLVVARALGHTAIGLDTDPLAVLIAKAWCTDVDEEKVLAKADDVLARSLSRLKELSVGDAYPKGAEVETRKFIRYWFDDQSRRQLTALSDSISSLRDNTLRSLLWCAFSRLIITKKIGVSLAMDVSHSRPHRVYEKAPIKPIEYFPRAVKSLINASPFKNNRNKLQQINIHRGDVRQIPLADKTVDIVITSPPYLNAIDYLRGHKLSLVWMGYSLNKLRSIRSNNVGAEKIATANESAYITQALKTMGKTDRLSDRVNGMLVRYIQDMNSALSEISRVLMEGGQAVLVVGDSTIRDTFIKNSNLVKFLGRKHDLDILSTRHRPLPENRRYLPPPTSNGAGSQLQNRMREEVIVKFERSSCRTTKK